MASICIWLVVSSFNDLKETWKYKNCTNRRIEIMQLTAFAIEECGKF